MKIAKSTHKKFLFTLFFEKVNGALDLSRQKNFSLDKLVDASNTYKKLKEASKETKDKDGNVTGFAWDEKELEFTDAETSVLKGLLGGLKEASLSEAEAITELKELLK